MTLKPYKPNDPNFRNQKPQGLVSIAIRGAARGSAIWEAGKKPK